MSNAVRITITADGVISYYFNNLDYIDWDAYEKNGWRYTPDILKSTRKLRIRLYNARSQVGSFANVGKYPVSHVELSVPPGNSSSFSLDIDISMYAPIKLHNSILVNWVPSQFEVDTSNSRTFRIKTSSNRRSLIIIITSDRRPIKTVRRSIDNVAESNRELKVSCSNGELSIHAKNARLADLIDSVSRSTGRRILVDSSTDRLITAELFNITLDELLLRLAEGYGLVISGTDDQLVLSDMLAGTTSAYVAGSSFEIPVRWLSAEKARNLLPAFLLDYIRVDEERNMLIVTGSQSLVKKVTEDLAKVDIPGRTVRLRARLFECSSTEDLAKELSVRWIGDDREISFNTASSDIFWGKLESPVSDIDARLAALVANQDVKITADSEAAVISGQTAELFAGLNKYVQFETTDGYYKEYVIEPVAAGTRIKVTPWTGGNDIFMSLTTVVTNIGEIDPMSRLPVVNTRSLEGTFRISQGESILIGGLTQTQNYNTTRKIPLLGDIPIVGGLFCKKIKQQVTSDLALLLTAETY